MKKLTKRIKSLDETIMGYACKCSLCGCLCCDLRPSATDSVNDYNDDRSSEVNTPVYQK